MQNPFQDDIFADDPAVLHGGSGNVPSIHDRVLRSITSEIAACAATGLQVPENAHGSTILLTAPRAGFGKSHLLARIATAFGNDTTLVKARFNLEETPGWDTLLRQTLEALRAPEPSLPTGVRSLARFRALARHVFGAITARLIERGEVPSANPEGAAAGVSRNCLRLFAPENDDQSVRDWLTNNFEQLRPAMARMLAEARGATVSGAAYWLDILREANDGPDEELAEYLEGCLPDHSGGRSDARISKRRLSDLCRVATLHRPIVFVFDHLDCFHGDTREGLRIAYLLAELRNLTPGQTAILAANDDLWQSAFGERLPSALADRLTAIPNRLSFLRPDEARDLVAARCHAAGVSEEVTARFLAGFDLGSEPDLSARAVLRKARGSWPRFLGGGGPDESAATMIDGGFPTGLLGDFGSEIPSVADLMDAETLRRARASSRSIEGEGFPSAGVSPFLIEPDDAYLNGPHSLHAILKSVPPADEKESGLPALKKSGDLLASLREKSTSAPENLRLSPPKPPRRPDGGSPDPRRHPVVERFEELRLGFARTEDSILQAEQLKELVALCGTQSPLIDSTEILLPGSADGAVLRWRYPGQLILLAFADCGASEFWRAFFRFAGEEGQRGAKLVAFAPADSAFPDGCGLERDDLPEPVRRRLDVVPLAFNSVANLRAAATLLGDSEAIAPATPGEALGILAEELDFFWRRLTRPLVPAQG